MKVEFKLELGNLGLLLTAVFVVLKLLRLVEWSWLTCFLPLIIGLIVALIIFIIAIIKTRRNK